MMDQDYFKLACDLAFARTAMRSVRPAPDWFPNEGDRQWWREQNKRRPFATRKVALEAEVVCVVSATDFQQHFEPAEAIESYECLSCNASFIDMTYYPYCGDDCARAADRENDADEDRDR